MAVSIVGLHKDDRRAVALKMLRGSIMKNGHGIRAENTVYRLLWLIKQKYDLKPPVDTLYEALYELAPRVALRTKKVAGTKYVIPFGFTYGNRDLSISVKWFISAARRRPGKIDMASKLFMEINDIFSNKGYAIAQRDKVHQQAIAGRPHLRFL